MQSFKNRLIFLVIVISQITGFSQEFNIKWSEEKNLKEEPFSEIIGSTDSVFYTIYMGAIDDYQKKAKEDKIVVSKYDQTTLNLISQNYLESEFVMNSRTTLVTYAGSQLNNKGEIVVYCYSFNANTISLYVQKINPSGEVMPLRRVYTVLRINSFYGHPKVIVNQKRQSDFTILFRGKEYYKNENTNSNIIAVTFNQYGELINTNSFETQLRARYFYELDTKADSAGNIYIAGYTLYKPGRGYSLEERLTRVFQDVQILKLPYQHTNRILNIINISIKDTYQNDIIIQPDFSNNELLVAAFIGEDSLKTLLNTKLLVRTLDQNTLDVIREKSISLDSSSIKKMPESVFFKHSIGLPPISINKITRDKEGMPVIFARIGGGKSALYPTGYQGGNFGPIFIFNLAKSEVKIARIISSAADDFGHYLALENNHNHIFLASCHRNLSEQLQTEKYRLPRSKNMAMGYFKVLDSLAPTFHQLVNAIPDKKYLVLTRTHFVNNHTAVIIARKGKKYQFGLLDSKNYSFINLEKLD